MSKFKLPLLLLALMVAFPLLASAADASYPTVTVEGLANGVGWMRTTKHVVRWTTTGSVAASTVSICKDPGYQPLWRGNEGLNVSNGSNCKIVSGGNMVTGKSLNVAIPSSLNAKPGDVLYAVVTFWGSQYGNFSQRFVLYEGITPPTSVADSPAYNPGSCYQLNLNGRIIIQNATNGNDYEVVEKVGKYLSHEINSSTGATFLSFSYKEPYYRDYDSRMVGAVKAWQKKYGLSQNGVVDYAFEDKLNQVTNCWQKARFDSLSVSAVAPNISTDKWARGTSKNIAWKTAFAPLGSKVKLYLVNNSSGAKVQIGTADGYDVANGSGNAKVDLPVNWVAGSHRLVAELFKSGVNSNSNFASYSSSNITVDDAIKNVKVVAANAGTNPASLLNWVIGGQAKVYWELFDLNSSTALNLELKKVGGSNLAPISPTTVIGVDNNVKPITLGTAALPGAYSLSLTAKDYPSLKSTSATNVSLNTSAPKVSNVGILPYPNTNGATYITEWSKDKMMRISWVVNSTPITYPTNSSIVLASQSGAQTFTLANVATANGAITTNLLGAGLGDSIADGYYRVGVKYGPGTGDVSYTGYFKVSTPYIAPVVTVPDQQSWPNGTSRDVSINTQGYAAGTVFRIYACSSGDLNCTGANNQPYVSLGQVTTSTKNPETLTLRGKVINFSLGAKSNSYSVYIRVEKGLSSDPNASVQVARSNDFPITFGAASAEPGKASQLAALLEALQQLIAELKGN